MRNSIRFIFLTCSLLGFSALAETVISQIKVNYAQSLFPADRQGFTIPQAIVGGKVDFTGLPPVYVTLRTGNFSYTQPTDQQGNFSFLVYTNSNQYSVEAWTGTGTPVVLKVNKM